jgi:hypothetical protein
MRDPPVSLPLSAPGHLSARSLHMAATCHARAGPLRLSTARSEPTPPQQPTAASLHALPTSPHLARYRQSCLKPPPPRFRPRVSEHATPPPPSPPPWVSAPRRCFSLRFTVALTSLLPSPSHLSAVVPRRSPLSRVCPSTIHALPSTPPTPPSTPRARSRRLPCAGEPPPPRASFSPHRLSCADEVAVVLPRAPCRTRSRQGHTHARVGAKLGQAARVLRRPRPAQQGRGPRALCKWAAMTLCAWAVPILCSWAAADSAQ